MRVAYRLQREREAVNRATIDWSAMINPRKVEPDTMVSIRVPQPLIDAAKAEAVRRGIPYSVLFREALVKLLQDAEA
jgi:predicted DNA binding CopG/RHH family protein